MAPTAAFVAGASLPGRAAGAAARRAACRGGPAWWTGPTARPSSGGGGMLGRRSRRPAAAAPMRPATSASGAAGRVRMAASASASAAGGGDSSGETGDTATPAGRLAALRSVLARRDLYAFVIPSADPHNSEAPPPAFCRRAWASGFTGSAGTALVTATDAYLWTDGRYFLQAEAQLSPEWTLMRAGMPGTPSLADTLASTVPPGKVVGIDATVQSVDEGRALAAALSGGGGGGGGGGGDGDGGEEVPPRRLSYVTSNPVDEVWGAGRPPLPGGPVRVHPARVAGEDVAAKVARMRSVMSERRADALVVCMLDEVAWLLNIRGEDVPHTPTVLSYALLTADDVRFYVQPGKVLPGSDAERHLATSGVSVHAYEAIMEDVAALAADGKSVWVDAASASVAIYEAAAGVDRANEAAVVTAPSPVSAAKAVKNAAELAGMRAAHVRDAVALVRFLTWLADTVAAAPTEGVRETVAADVLETYRAGVPHFLTPSFETISGSGANGAIIHYSAAGAGSTAAVTADDMYLLDSGGQYVDGTTDVTRTMHHGTPSAYQRGCFTRVLQGHIALASAVFPPGTTGLMLDALARLPLWRAGLDYRHGTGHGVGAALNVHEGPHSIAPRPAANGTALAVGMVVSNEPGYYEEGAFGIRIENLVEVVPAETAGSFGGGGYMRFRELTLVPLDRGLIDVALLSDAEVAWVDAYHARVWAEVAPGVEATGDTRALDWLRCHTRPLEPVGEVRGEGVAAVAAA
ncbi:hypothetical protein MMPV_000717 [Pyropia vietnamensis]